MAEVREDWIGKKFGRLTILGFGAPYIYQGKTQIKRIKTFECLCDCGEKATIVCYSVEKGRSKSCGKCRDFSLQKEKTRELNKKRVGDKNPSWNSKITKEEREKNKYLRKSKKYILWREKVFKRDKYRCKICFSNKHLMAHHLDSFSSNIKKRFWAKNGITLCAKCHKKFHVDFMGGYHKRCSKKDFEEYKKVALDLTQEMYYT